MKSHPDFGVLVEYWLDDKIDEPLEEHLLGCAECSARLEELAALGAGIRAAFRGGALQAVLPRAFVERLKREGLRVREYRVPAGGSVNCTMAADDDLVLSRLEAALGGVERVDLELLGPGGDARATLEDIPFDPAAGEVLFCPTPAVLRTLPAHTERMRLVAVGAEGRKPIGDYTFFHTPS